MIKSLVKQTTKVIITAIMFFLFESQLVYAHFLINEDQLIENKKTIFPSISSVNYTIANQLAIDAKDSSSNLNFSITNENMDAGIIVSGVNNNEQPEIFLSGKGFVINVNQPIMNTNHTEKPKQNMLVFGMNHQKKKLMIDHLNIGVYLNQFSNSANLDFFTIPLKHSTETIKVSLNNGIFSSINIFSREL